MSTFFCAAAAPDSDLRDELQLLKTEQHELLRMLWAERQVVTQLRADLDAARNTGKFETARSSGEDGSVALAWESQASILANAVDGEGVPADVQSANIATQFSTPKARPAVLIAPAKSAEWDASRGAFFGWPSQPHLVRSVSVVV